MSILTRIGAKEAKYELDIIIHFIQIKCANSSGYQIRVNRGSRKKQKTSIMPNEGEITSFQYPMNFHITMYHKNGTYANKDLTFTVKKIVDNRKKIDGKLQLEIVSLVTEHREIVEKTYPLKNCSDKTASICLSVSLVESNNRGRHSVQQSHSSEPSSASRISENRRTVENIRTIEGNEYIEKITEENQPRLAYKFNEDMHNEHSSHVPELPSDETKYSNSNPELYSGILKQSDHMTEQSDSAKLSEEENAKITQEKQNSSEMPTRSDTGDGNEHNIKRVRTSKIYSIVEGNLSSEDEDEETVKIRRSLLEPTSNMKDVLPNFNSKNTNIKSKENSAGLAEGRKSNCSGCLLF